VGVTKESQMSGARHAVGRITNEALARFDLAVVRRSRLDRSTHIGMLAHLSGLGLKPSTVFDIGAARGEWAVLSSGFFPDANYLLVEPLTEFTGALTRAQAKMSRATVIQAAAAASSGPRPLNVHSDLVGSSLLHESEGPGTDGVVRIVRGVPIDDLAFENAAGPPYLFKIDVQGAELEVLAGATRVLADTQALVLEVSLLPFFVDGPSLSDVVCAMASLGFSVYDVIGHTYRPVDNALAQVDLVFLPVDSPLRADPRFATEQQRQEQDARMRAWARR